MDHEGNIIRWSGKAERMFGWSEEEALGSHPRILRLIQADDLETASAAFRGKLEGKENTFVQECKCSTKNGTFIFCEWYHSLYFDDNGKLLSVLSLVNDITFQKLQEATKWKGQLEDRKRIARELHEGIGQLLVATKYKVASIDPVAAECIEDKSGEVEHFLENTIQEVRRISLSMAPRSEEQIGIENVIRKLCREVEEATAIKISFTYIGLSCGAGNNVLSTIFVIVQETLNNIVKHARASQVSIKVLIKEKKVKVVVKDDGEGFDLEKINFCRSRGLGNIKERTQLLGGSFQIKKREPRGVKLAISIPC